MGWDTAAVANEEARKCLEAGRDLEDSFARVMSVLSRHVRAAPPAAVGRAVAEFRRTPTNSPRREGSDWLWPSKRCSPAPKRSGNSLPTSGQPRWGRCLQALVMDSILDWSSGHSDLGAAYAAVPPSSWPACGAPFQSLANPVRIATWGATQHVAEGHILLSTVRFAGIPEPVR